MKLIMKGVFIFVYIFTLNKTSVLFLNVLARVIIIIVYACNYYKKLASRDSKDFIGRRHCPDFSFFLI